MKKILIIDDDPDIREVLSTILEGKYELRQAPTSEEGRTTLREFLPDLTLLDVMMERHDSGFNLAREIKNDEQLKDIKILMLTNVDNEMNMDFKTTAGDPDWLPVDDYVIKPIDPKVILEKVEKLLGE
jgi:CheY-like chemotaxis protein